MKKILIIIISAILIGLVGLGIIGYYVEKDKEVEENHVQVEEKVETKVEEEKLVVDINKFNINKIENYTPWEEVIKSDSEASIKDININGRSLPYTIPNKNMEIISIGEYSGKFIEDGSDIKKDNVLSMVVKNTSEDIIDYGEITMRVRGKNNTIKFEITNLKPGACALVMESSGKVEFNSEDQYMYISSKNNMISDFSMMEPEIDITTEDNKITIKNLTDKDLNTVYVYYKTISEGNCYLGGVTYRAKFEDIKSKKSDSVNTLHFSNVKSEILKVELVK